MENLRANFIRPAERQYKVYAYGSSLNGEPLYIVGRSKRDEMLAKSEATSMSGGKVLKLTKRLYDLRGESCAPNHALIHRYVASAFSGNDRGARTVIDGAAAVIAKCAQDSKPAVKGWAP